MAITLGGLEIQPARRAMLHGRVLPLRPLDLRVLALLAREPRRTWSRASIADELWGPDATIHARTVDVCIARIRRAFNGSGHAIVTVRRVGYRLDPDRLAGGKR